MNSNTQASGVKVAGKTRLQLKGVSRRYEQGGAVIDVLRDADLEVRGGELTALVGPSGSGKSTLLNVAGLLERPTGGEVVIDGTATSKLGTRRRGRIRGSHIGFVFQFHRLLPEFSALENVMIPQMLGGLSRVDSETRAEQLLAMVGLRDRAGHRPGTLSGGEQQRVAIARAVANADKHVMRHRHLAIVETAVIRGDKRQAGGKRSIQEDRFGPLLAGKPVALKFNIDPSRQTGLQGGKTLIHKRGLSLGRGSADKPVPCAAGQQDQPVPVSKKMIKGYYRVITALDL